MVPLKYKKEDQDLQVIAFNHLKDYFTSIKNVLR